MDKIILNNAKLFCNIGVEESERSEKQEIDIKVTIFTDTTQAAKTDRIADTINYSDVHSKIKSYVQSKAYNLIETLAEDIANICLTYDKVKKVKVKVTKPCAMAKKNVREVSIEIVRECRK